MAATATRDMTLAEVAFRNLVAEYEDPQHPRIATLKATKKAAEAITTVACLAICADKGAGVDGGWPTQAQYADWWNITERQAQREWELFKRAFPGEESPDRMAQVLLARHRRLLEGARGKPGVAFSVPFRAVQA